LQPFSPDDLMMHVVAYKFSYDYHALFVHSSPLPNYNPWFGFQIVAGKFHQLLGDEYSVRAIQCMAVVLFYLSFFLALNKVLKERKDKWLWFTIIFMLCAPLFTRVFNARPDVFYTAWLISAVFLRPILWLAIGILIMPGYLLSIIYAPGALLLNTSWRNKIIYGGMFAASCIVFWYLYSDGEWLHLPQIYSIWAQNRVMNITETAPITYMLIDPYFLSLLIMLCYFLYRASFKLNALAISFCLVIAYFLLPNYTRYTMPMIAMMGLMCALYAPKELKFSQGPAFIILIISSLLIYRSIPNIPYEKFPKFNIPSGAVVLTEFNAATAASILHNPHVKYAPAMEIGATDQAVQKLTISLNQGSGFDCTELKKFSFTHVQEGHLKVVPPCLKLSQIDGNWRLWEIK
jgi:hypothetical protein